MTAFFFWPNGEHELLLSAREGDAAESRAEVAAILGRLDAAVAPRHHLAAKQSALTAAGALDLAESYRFIREQDSGAEHGDAARRVAVCARSRRQPPSARPGQRRLAAAALGVFGWTGSSWS